jgi:hypothetical protein
MDGTLRGLGLTTPWYAALSVLGNDPGTSGAALTRRCFVTPQTMSQIVSNLEGAGLIPRPRPSGARVHLAGLSDGEGRGVVWRGYRIVEAVEERMLAPGSGRAPRAPGGAPRPRRRPRVGLEAVV